jgi:hypothetical protein
LRRERGKKAVLAFTLDENNSAPALWIWYILIKEALIREQQTIFDSS